MSAFYDLASLVLVPSGYKASKVYAQKPLTTDGQLTFSRASTATRVNSAGLIETVSSNVPRLDYLGSTCPKLLLEPQRTNLLPYSQQMDQASYWNAISGDLVVTANAVNSPDGTQNADGIALANSANRYFVSASLTLTPGQVYTYTVYMKSASGNLSIAMGGVNGLPAVLKTVTTQWQRFTYTFTMHASGSEYFGFDQRSTGASTSGTVYFWGAQVELGAYATSYVKTEAAAVTRLADACSKTGISSLIGQTEGVIFIDWIYTERDLLGILPITISNGTGITNAYIYIDNNNKVFFDFVVNGTATGRIATGNSYAVKGTRYKMACAYKANDFVFYINGTQIGTDNSGAIAALSQLDFGYPFASGYSLPNTINQALLFKTRLTNAQLAELTAL